MNLVNSIFSFFNKKGTVTEQEFPSGVCPNCWGREEYGGYFYEAIKNENINIHDRNTSVGWVQDYANKHLSGITFQRNENKELACKKCKLVYKYNN